MGREKRQQGPGRRRGRTDRDDRDHEREHDGGRDVHRDGPSRFLALANPESVPIIVDALLDLPPGREVTQTELAEYAGVTRQTVWRYVDELVDLDVIDPVPDSSPRRYRLADSPVVQALVELNASLDDAGEW